MPGAGVRIAATMLVEIVDVGRFGSAGNPAAYAGVAPIARERRFTVSIVTGV
jgi:transposase